ncbi:hypothetical protein [Dyella humicola]|uniref:hypothetical protein n=1 Tax=Dyella humicola TaxID=2992126 RepID=UPI002252B478|nr:hypothetical protein [Dyella humicola]
MDFLDAFLGDAKKWIVGECSIDLRFVARKSSTPDTYEIVHASLAVLPLPDQRSKDLDFELEANGFWFGQQHADGLSAQEAINIVADACAGFVVAYGRHLKLTGYGRNFRALPVDNEWVASTLGISIGSQAPWGHREDVSLLEVNETLRRSSPPFDGLEDILSWLALQADLGSEDRKLNLIVHAPVNVRADKTKVEDGAVHLTVVAHPNLEFDDVTVALRGAPPKGVAHRMQVADRIVWADSEDDVRYGTAKIEMPGIDAAQVILSLGFRYIFRQWFTDAVRSRNERYLAVRLFDANLKQLRRFVLEDSNSDKFEIAIAALAFMSGFSPGMTLETSAPDIVVSTPTGRLVLVECTIKTSDVHLKIGKLVDRREALRKALQGDGRQVSLLSVLVCQSSRENVAAEDRELAQKGILLLCREDLQTHLDGALHAPIDPDQMYKDALDHLMLLSRPTSTPSTSGDLF